MLAKLSCSTLNTRAQAVSHPICFDFLNETIENKTANGLSFDICAVDNFLDTYIYFHLKYWHNFKNALAELHKKLNKPCVMGDISESLEYFCTTVKQRTIEKYVENVIRKTFLHKAYSTVWNISTLICHKRTYQILLFLGLLGLGPSLFQ